MEPIIFFIVCFIVATPLWIIGLQVVQQLTRIATALEERQLPPKEVSMKTISSVLFILCTLVSPALAQSKLGPVYGFERLDVPLGALEIEWFVTKVEYAGVLPIPSLGPATGEYRAMPTYVTLYILGVGGGFERRGAPHQVVVTERPFTTLKVSRTKGGSIYRLLLGKDFADKGDVQAMQRGVYNPCDRE